MKIPPAMFEMFLRSAGAPQSMIDLLQLVQAEGFGAFGFAPIPADDPAWTKIGATEDRSRFGVWVRAEGPTSRISAAIFLEGVSDEALKTLQSALPPTQLGATTHG